MGPEVQRGQVAIHAVTVTLLVAVLLLAHTPWAHWLDRLGDGDERADGKA